MPFTSPSVRVEELAFGDVVAGEEYSFEFMVGNIGDAPTEGAGLGAPVDASGCVGPADNRLCFERRSGNQWLGVAAFPQELAPDGSIHLRGVWAPAAAELGPPLDLLTVVGAPEPLGLWCERGGHSTARGRSCSSSTRSRRGARS